MERITLILERKGAHLHTVSSESPITDALQQMRSENVDYLVVLNDNERFLGILTDHDIATKIVFEKKPFHKISVREGMNTGLPGVTTEDTVEKCMKMMRQHNVRFLPVFDGFDFKGVISTDDIIYEVVKNRMDVFDPEDDHSYTFA